MAEDASLEDFSDGGESSRSVEDGSTEIGTETADGEASVDGVEPAESTYAWSPEGATCAECGEVVKRRWTQDGVLVCGACKSW